MLKKFSLVTKQISGFVLVALMTAVVGAVGIYGLRTTGDNFDLCMDVEVPRADASMEGIIAIISSRDIMGEFLLTEDTKKFDTLAAEQKRFAADFMKYSEYLASHGTEVIKRQTRQAQEMFAAFQSEAKELMEHQRSHVEADAQADASMEFFDQTALMLKDGLIEAEAKLTETVKIDERVDAAMESKTFMFEQKATAEEYMALEEIAGAKELTRDFLAKGAEFQKLASLLPPDVVEMHKQFQDHALTMFKYHDQAMEMRAETHRHMERANAASLKVTKAFQEVEEVAVAGMTATMDRADAAQEFSLILLLAITASGFVLAVLLGVLISRSIAGPIRAVITGLTAGSHQVTDAATQVSSASQTLAQGASEQAASLEETTASMEEMSSMTKTNADNASQADNLMSEAGLVVAEAGQSMSDLKGAMERINAASGEMAKIIKTIDEIAFQTNLLALNAAVEAARAGEAGAGFAVVADEVRNLALRAAEAAKSTSELIEGNINNIKEGTQLVATTDEAFGKVQKSAGRVAELVGEIAAASGEQSQGIDQISNATTEMDAVTQQVASNAEESAAASEELSAQAVTMQGFVNNLVSLVESSGKSEASQAPRLEQPIHRQLTGSTPGQPPVETAPSGRGNQVQTDSEDFSDF